MSLGGVGRPSRKGAVQEPEVSNAGFDERWSRGVRSTVGVTEPKIEVDCEPSGGGDIGTEV